MCAASVVRMEIAMNLLALPGPDFWRDMKMMKAVGGAAASVIRNRTKTQGKGILPSGIYYQLRPTGKVRGIFPRSGKWSEARAASKNPKTRNGTSGFGDFPAPLSGGEDRGANWEFFDEGYTDVKAKNATVKTAYKNLAYSGAMFKAMKVRSTAPGQAEIYFEGAKEEEKAQKQMDDPKRQFFGIGRLEQNAVERAIGTKAGYKMKALIAGGVVVKTKGYRGQPPLTYRQALAFETYCKTRGLDIGGSEMDDEFAQYERERQSGA